MKKTLSLVLTMVLAVVMTACGNAGSIGQAESSVTSTSVPMTEEESEHTEKNQDETGNKILVTYFSRTGENHSVGYIEKGNTHIIADMIAEQTGGDTFEISTVTPYPDDYDECTDIAQQEQKENARPELAESLDNLEDYDVIFIGYPIWWGDMPMAVYTFLESYDFSGKTIVPFCTHEGSGLSSTQESIAAICPDAEILDGLAIRGSVAQNSQDEANEAVTEWLRQMGFIE